VAEAIASALHLVVLLVQIIREDPRIGLALVILLGAGILMAIVIRRRRQPELPTIK
jgi:hypothetical protein